MPATPRHAALRVWNANVRILPVDGPGAARTRPVRPTIVTDSTGRSVGCRPTSERILVFTHYLGLTPTEIAERLGIPVGTARSRLHYAHRAMRAAIEADERPVAVAGGRPR